MITSIYLIAKILSMVKIPYLQDYLKRALERTWEWSSFLDLYWNTYIYALIGALLQFRCYNDDDSSSWINYLLHSVVSIPTILCPFVFIWVIYRQKDIKNNAVFLKKYSSFVSGIKLFSVQDKKAEEPEKGCKAIDSVE